MKKKNDMNTEILEAEAEGIETVEAENMPDTAESEVAEAEVEATEIVDGETAESEGTEAADAVESEDTHKEGEVVDMDEVAASKDTSELLALADGYFADGKFRDALAFYKRASKEFSDAYEGFWGACKCKLELTYNAESMKAAEAYSDYAFDYSAALKRAEEDKKVEISAEFSAYVGKIGAKQQASTGFLSAMNAGSSTAAMMSLQNIKANNGVKKTFKKDYIVLAVLFVAGIVAVSLTAAGVVKDRDFFMYAAAACCLLGVVAMVLQIIKAKRVIKFIENGETSVTELMKKLKIKKKGDMLTLLGSLIKEGKLVNVSISGGEDIALETAQTDQT